MANRRSTRQSEFESLDPAHQLRIKRSLKIAGVWSAGVLLSAAAFVLAKPYIKRKRLERMKQPGYKPYAVLRERPPYSDEGSSSKSESTKK
jgi:hypothetical protein